MRVLLVYAHPEPTSFTAALKNTALAALRDAGHTVEVSDLYGEGFNPVAGRHDFLDASDPARFHYQTEQGHAHKTGTFAPDIVREQQRFIRSPAGRAASVPRLRAALPRPAARWRSATRRAVRRPQVWPRRSREPADNAWQCRATSPTPMRCSGSRPTLSLVSAASIFWSTAPASGHIAAWGAMDAAFIRAILDANVLGTVLVTQAVLPHLTAPGGRIVNFASAMAFRPIPASSVYSASKAAVITLTHAWSKELGPRGITVNAIAPGVIETDTTATILAERGAGIVASTPPGRVGQTDDIAGIALFLCSSEAGWITGRTIIADGGVT